MRPITVQLYDTLERGAESLANVGINPLITALSWTSTLPGGPNTLSVGIVEPEMRSGWGESYAYIPEPVGVKPFAHVIVQVGSYVAWEGRVVEDEIGPSGYPQAFIADGYGLAAANNDVYVSTDTSATTTGEIIADIITAAASLLRKGNAEEWDDPLVAHSRSEFTQMTLAEALDQVMAEGGSQYVTWDWWVTLGRHVSLKARVAPATPDYHIPFQPGRVSIRRNYRDIATHAYVAYTDNNVEFTTAEEESSTTVSEYRIRRRVRIQADELSSSAAVQLRSTELLKRSQPVTSITIERGPSEADWLTTPGGALVPHWAVQAGQWVQVANRDPEIIVSASYEPSRGLTLDLGAQSRQSFAVYLAKTCAEVGKLSKGINPVTGGRRRGIRQQSSVTALTNANGTYDGTIADVSSSHNQTILNANFRDLSDTVNLLRTQLVNAKVLP
jgi:hypothetical protein